MKNKTLGSDSFFLGQTTQIFVPEKKRKLTRISWYMMFDWNGKSNDDWSFDGGQTHITPFPPTSPAHAMRKPLVIATKHIHFYALNQASLGEGTHVVYGFLKSVNLVKVYMLWYAPRSLYDDPYQTHAVWVSIAFHHIVSTCGWWLSRFHYTCSAFVYDSAWHFSSTTNCNQVYLMWKAQKNCAVFVLLRNKYI